MAGRYAREALKLGQFFVFLPVRFFFCARILNNLAQVLHSFLGVNDPLNVCEVSQGNPTTFFRCVNLAGLTFRNLIQLIGLMAAKVSMNSFFLYGEQT